MKFVVAFDEEGRASDGCDGRTRLPLPIGRYPVTVPLRVLHVIASMATGDGGPVECVRQLVRFLPVSGVETTLVTTDRRLRDDGSELANLGRVLVARARPPDRFNFAPAVRPLVRAEVRNCDVVHVHAVNNYASSVAVRTSQAYGIPVVLQPHGAYDDYHVGQNRLAKGLYHRAVDARAFDAVAAVVSSSAREAEGVRSFLGAQSVTIPLGVDPELLTVRRSESRGSVLFLGRVTEKKSVDLVIEAFAQSGLARSGVRLTIAGPVDRRLRYDPHAIALQLGISDAVDFIGPVDSSHRAALLATSDVFVLPSQDESFGVSVAEAMAAGCAVIASPQVGIAPAAASRGVLKMVERDHDMWSRALTDLFRDPEGRLSMGAAARAYAQSEFDWATIAGRFAQLYRSIVT